MIFLVTCFKYFVKISLFYSKVTQIFTFAFNIYSIFKLFFRALFSFSLFDTPDSKPEDLKLLGDGVEVGGLKLLGDGVEVGVQKLSGDESKSDY